ncbi:MAG: phosphate signaling complex protein PhoU [Candidatus Hydrogenedentes bacterium]|nr:phosphate signaling complex protein PhoU [Candidatus Hydrogenedentota bacterium]
MSIHLQKEIERLKKNLLALSAIVEDSVYRAVKSLKERDEALARAVISGDNDIDLQEVEIEEECQKILALHQPVAYDLRFIIAILKINAELERIGDATVSIAERVLLLVTEDQVDAPFDFAAMAQKAQQMLHKSLDALISLDAGLAYDVITADNEVDAINREMYGQIEECIRRDSGRVNSFIHLMGVSRHIERIADHASNIAEDVIYLVEGRILRHHIGEYRRPEPGSE